MIQAGWYMLLATVLVWGWARGSGTLVILGERISTRLAAEKTIQRRIWLGVAIRGGQG